VANSEQIIAVFSAAWWFPTKRKFFLDKAIVISNFESPIFRK
jgi:hypothetical protein